MNESAAIAVTKPAFDSDVVNCCRYDFGAYIFGQQNPVDPVFQTIQVPSPGGSTAADIQLPGPLFIGFIADLVPNGGNGVSSFFQQAYNLPDIALNHPSRWNWSKSEEQVSFNSPNASPNPLDDAFYWMQGLFISESGSNSSLNLSAATAGNELWLRARVYNYSLVDTNSPTLAHPAASIHVRFYGHAVNSSLELVGNAFLIGETQIAAIPGFDSSSNGGTQPN